jgi:hypothetical protein
MHERLYLHCQSSAGLQVPLSREFRSSSPKAGVRGGRHPLVAAKGADAPFCWRASRIPSAHTWELSSVRAFIAFAVSFTASCCRQAMVLRPPTCPACCVHAGTHVVSMGKLETYTGGAPREYDDADDKRQQDAGTDAQNPCHHDKETACTRGRFGLSSPT